MYCKHTGIHRMGRHTCSINAVISCMWREGPFVEASLCSTGALDSIYDSVMLISEKLPGLNNCLELHRVGLLDGTITYESLTEHPQLKH